VDAEGGLIGISIQCDGAGVKSSADNAYGEEMEVFLDMDYTQPKVQKGLHDLEALDYITGQADRHAGNIFVDPKSGKVTGIDNDLAFPEVDREKMIEDGGSKLQCKAVLGPPRMMHEETASKIENMDPDALRAALKSVQPPDGSDGLNDKQIEGTVKRLNDLKVAIASARNGGSAMQIVPEFTKETYQRALETQQKVGLGGSTKITSYIGKVESIRADSRVEQAVNRGSHGVRDPATARKAEVNPAYAAYAKMHPDRREDFRGLQRSLDRLDKDLKSATMKDRLAALRHGGVEREKKLLDKKIGKLEGDRDKVNFRVGEFLKEPAIKADGPTQQAKVESKQHVGDVLRSQRAAKAPAADQHHAGENNVGSKMAKRPAIVVGGTSSATLRH
jgi:Phosphatidylinositol 3- and 4-kinase